MNCYSNDYVAIGLLILFALVGVVAVVMLVLNNLHAMKETK